MSEIEWTFQGSFLARSSCEKRIQIDEYFVTEKYGEDGFTRRVALGIRFKYQGKDISPEDDQGKVFVIDGITYRR